MNFPPTSTTETQARGAWQNRSGTITTGGTAQTLAAYFENRRLFFFQNPSDTGMWLSFDATAVADQPSILIPANGGYYENPPHFCPTGPVSVMCASTGKSFTCKEA